MIGELIKNDESIKWTLDKLVNIAISKCNYPIVTVAV